MADIRYKVGGVLPHESFWFVTPGSWWRWHQEQHGFGRRLDYTIRIHGPVTNVRVYNRTMEVEVFLAACGVKL